MSTDPIITDNPSVPAAAQSLQSRLRKHEQLASRLMDEKHDLIVYVPPMYDAQPDRRYPALFMQDGQNLFDPETSFIKGNYWHMGETADELILSGQIEPLIIVGIYNTGVHRINEYTPLEDKRLGGGRADAYGQMLVEELKPFIDHAYRTLPGAENCGMGGSSLGRIGFALSRIALHLGVQQAGADVSVGVVAQSRHPQDSSADHEETRTADLARRGHERRAASVARRARAEKGLDQEGMEARQRPRLHRGAGRRTFRMGLGTARRAHAEVPVSTARISNADRPAAASPMFSSTYNRDRRRA